jgi:hypothetical protein
MGREFIASIVTVITAIIGLAIIATLVSKNAQTGQVITQSGSALSNVLQAAESPVTGGGSFGSGLLGGMSSLGNFE